jgi:hypothetical protein
MSSQSDPAGSSGRIEAWHRKYEEQVQVKKEAYRGEKIMREPALYMSGGTREGILFV